MEIISYLLSMLIHTPTSVLILSVLYCFCAIIAVMTASHVCKPPIFWSLSSCYVKELFWGSLDSLSSLMLGICDFIPFTDSFCLLLHYWCYRRFLKWNCYRDALNDTNVFKTLNELESCCLVVILEGRSLVGPFIYDFVTV